MSQVATQSAAVEDFSVGETLGTSGARQFRLDQPHPHRVERAEQALRQLRNRIERHVEQEVRLGRMYQGWEARWSAQCDEMQQQVARLETYLTAWLPAADEAPTLSIVGSSHDGE